LRSPVAVASRWHNLCLLRRLSSPKRQGFKADLCGAGGPAALRGVSIAAAPSDPAGVGPCGVVITSGGSTHACVIFWAQSRSGRIPWAHLSSGRVPGSPCAHGVLWACPYAGKAPRAFCVRCGGNAVRWRSTVVGVSRWRNPHLFRRLSSPERQGSEVDLRGAGGLAALRGVSLIAAPSGPAGAWPRGVVVASCRPFRIRGLLWTQPRSG